MVYLGMVKDNSYSNKKNNFVKLFSLRKIRTALHEIVSLNHAKIAFSLILILAVRLPAFTQKLTPTISYSKNTLALNERFYITITTYNEELKTATPFPEVSGFVKKIIKKTSSIEDNLGELTSTFSSIQEYAPMREGRYTLPTFTIVINSQNIKAKTINITVGPANNQITNPNTEDELDNIEVKEPSIPEPDFIPDTRSKESPFLNVSVSNKSVFRGEGFTLRFSLLVPNNFVDDIQFYELDAQINELLKKLRPANCWEQDFGLEQVMEYKTKVGRKAYTEYRIYQGTFYPLNAQKIIIPALVLKMLVQKERGKTVAGLPLLVTSNPIFSSEAVEIDVKELPPHPLRDVVPSGVYRMSEQISKNNIKTGQAVKYHFTVKGTGNPSALRLQETPPNSSIEVFPPYVLQKMSNSGVLVVASKEFRYQIMPREPGKQPLENLFQFIFFNTKKEKYDTLKSNIVLLCTGKSLGAATAGKNKESSFYDLASESVSNTINQNHSVDSYKLYLNIGLALLFVAGIGVIFWRV
jgi:hypothetical protein